MRSSPPWVLRSVRSLLEECFPLPLPSTLNLSLKKTKQNKWEKNAQIPKSHMLYQLSLPGAPQLLTVLVSVHVSEKTAMAEKVRNTVQGSHVTDSVDNGEQRKLMSSVKST